MLRASSTACTRTDCRVYSTVRLYSYRLSASVLVNIHEEFSLSRDLCFTEYKVIGSTLKSVIIHLPDPVDLKGKKTLGLQQKLVLLSRTRRTEDLAFLCHDDYDFPQFLKALHVATVVIMTETACTERAFATGNRVSIPARLSKGRPGSVIQTLPRGRLT
eukprot:COSAG01_NODE_1494_length_10125_cov_93.590805_6_plen_160_part_00